jgi:hypothetical protein
MFTHSLATAFLNASFVFFPLFFQGHYQLAERADYENVFPWFFFRFSPLFFQGIINSQNAQIMKMHEYLVKEDVKNPSSNVAAGAPL